MHFKMSSAICFILNHSKILLVKVNSLPSDKILDKTVLKAFADNKINVAQMMIFAFDGIEHIVGKEKNTSTFSFSHNVFKSC